MSQYEIYYLLPANTTYLLYECLNTNYIIFFQLIQHISCTSVSIRNILSSSSYYHRSPVRVSQYEICCLLPANTTYLLYECLNTKYVIFFQLTPQISCTSVSIRNILSSSSYYHRSPVRVSQYEICYFLPANTTDLLYECLNTKYVIFFQLTPQISCTSVSIRNMLSSSS